MNSKISQNDFELSLDTFANDILNNADDEPEHKKAEEPNPTNIAVYEATDNTVETFKPKITRPTMSKFEFVRTITAAAKYIYSLTSIDKYVDDIEIKSIINPSELAFKLLMSGKINATIDRLGYEKVTFSELKINQIWIRTIETYFTNRAKSEVEEIYKPFGLMDA